MKYALMMALLFLSDVALGQPAPDCEMAPASFLDMVLAATSSTGGLTQTFGIIGLAVLVLGLVRDGLAAMAEKSDAKWDNVAVKWFSKAINMLARLIGKFGYGNVGEFRLKKKS